MNKAVFLLIVLLCPFWKTLAQEKIEFGKAPCAYCNMIIKDKAHASQALDFNGDTTSFGSIECLMNYIYTHTAAKFKTLYVSEYTGDGNFLEVQKAIYLKTEAIKSPMGANISAFKSTEEAEKYSRRDDDIIYNWAQLSEIFKASALGASNHPPHDHFRPDSHAPIGIMGDHLHHRGSLMISLRYMNMQMAGTKAGIQKIEDVQIFNSYKVAPQTMAMDMYMLGLMYAPSNKLTLMLMQNIIRKDMSLTSRMLMNETEVLNNFSTNSTGLGDMNIYLLYGLLNKSEASLHLNAGMGIPLGNIKQHSDTPMQVKAKLPYSMQLGTGTLDFSAGATYKETYSDVSWGSQFIATFRTGKNSEGYRFGNLYQLSTWGAYRLSKEISLSGRILGAIEEKIQGKDAELDSMMVPTAYTRNYGSKKVKTFGGINIAFPATSSLRDLRLGAEIGSPIYEDYKGIQMDEDLSYTIGLKYTIL